MWVKKTENRKQKTENRKQKREENEGVEWTGEKWRMKLMVWFGSTWCYVIGCMGKAKKDVASVLSVSKLLQRFFGDLLRGLAFVPSLFISGTLRYVPTYSLPR